MRVYAVNYAGMTERPGRTISGEIVVEATNLGTAARKAVWEIVERERIGSVSKVRSINLRIGRGPTIKKTGGIT